METKPDKRKLAMTIKDVLKKKFESWLLKPFVQQRIKLKQYVINKFLLASVCLKAAWAMVNGKVKKRVVCG